MTFIINHAHSRTKLPLSQHLALLLLFKGARKTRTVYISPVSSYRGICTSEGSEGETAGSGEKTGDQQSRKKKH